MKNQTVARKLTHNKKKLLKPVNSLKMEIFFRKLTVVRSKINKIFILSSFSITFAFHFRKD